MNEYDSHMGYSHGGYSDGGYSDEGYYNDEDTYERSSNEDYGTEFSVPVEEEEFDYYDNQVAF